MTQDKVSRIEVELAPGYYWRLKQALHENHVKEVRHGSFREHMTGSSTDLLAEEGAILLLTDVQLVEDQPHSVYVKSHPLEDGWAHVGMLIADFLGFFEPVDEETANLQRESDLNAYNEDTQRQQHELLALSARLPTLPAAPDGGRPALEAPTPSDNAAPTVGSVIATRTGSAGEMRQQLTATKEAMEQHSALVKEKTTALQERFEVVGKFLDERAAVAQARMKPAARMIKRLGEGIETIALYTGEGIDIEQIRDGRSAPPDAPLHLYQRLLYMDEESLINAARGGADFEKVPAFFEALRTQPALVQRILPAERAMVVMQISRHSRRYSKDGLENAILNQRNEEHFLLIRDGERLHAVYCEMPHINELPRLFPTKDDFGRPFKGVFGERITVQDMRFPSSVEGARLVQLMYQRILVLLWGLRDNHEVLGPLGGDPPPSLLSADAQKKLFRFIYDDEHALSDQSRPGWRGWWGLNNRKLASGSRVLVWWNNHITERNAPGVFSRESWRSKNDPYCIVDFDDGDYSLVTTRREGNELVVRTPVTVSYSRDRQFQARVRLAYMDDEPDQSAFLVLDHVTADDLVYYIESRHERRGYLEYIPAFAEAMRVLREEEPAEHALLDAVNARRQEYTRKDLATEERQAAFEAMRRWRAAHQWALPEGERAFTDCLDVVYHAVFVQADHLNEQIRQAEAVARELDAEPLRLAISGKKRTVLYARTNEAPAGFDVEASPWVKRLCLRMTKDGARVDSQSFAILPAIAPKEQVLHEWSAAKEWVALGEKAPVRRPTTLVGDLEVAKDAVEAIVQRLDGLWDQGFYEDWVREYRRYSGRLGTVGMVRNAYYYLPLGYISARGKNSTQSGFLCASVCGDRLLYLIANSEGSREFLWQNGFRGLYRYPNVNFNRLLDVRTPGDARVSLVLIDAKDLRTGLTTGSCDEKNVDYKNGRFSMSRDELMDIARTAFKEFGKEMTVLAAVPGSASALEKITAAGNVYTEKPIAKPEEDTSRD